MRTSTISAAAAGRVAVCTSVMPFSSICHIRDSTRIDSLAANSRARTRSVSPKATLSAVAGTTFTRVTKLTNSARSDSTTIGSAPMSYCSRNSLKAPAISPPASFSNRSMTRVRSASPSICRTSSARTVPAACAIA